MSSLGDQLPANPLSSRTMFFGVSRRSPDPSTLITKIPTGRSFFDRTNTSRFPSGE